MAEAVMIAERIRTNIQKAKIPHRGSQLSPWLSASFGVAQWVKGYSFAVLAEKADKELYKAKQAGRNQASSTKGALLLPAHHFSAHLPVSTNGAFSVSKNTLTHSFKYLITAIE